MGRRDRNRMSDCEREGKGYFSLTFLTDLLVREFPPYLQGPLKSSVKSSQGLLPRNRAHQEPSLCKPPPVKHNTINPPPTNGSYILLVGQTDTQGLCNQCLGHAIPCRLGTFVTLHFSLGNLILSSASGRYKAKQMKETRDPRPPTDDPTTRKILSVLYQDRHSHLCNQRHQFRNPLVFPWLCS